MKKSSLPSRRQPLARSKKPIKRSKYAYEGDLRVKRKKRKPSEFARIYGSKERVEFVKRLPCAACGVVGYSENAHVLGNGGLSRKGDYASIAPLCGPHRTYETYGWSEGCHRYLHRAGLTRFQKYQFPDFNPEQVASQTEKAWQEYSGTSNKDEASND